MDDGNKDARDESTDGDNEGDDNGNAANGTLSDVDVSSKFESSCIVKGKLIDGSDRSPRTVRFLVYEGADADGGNGDAA